MLIIIDVYSIYDEKKLKRLKAQIAQMKYDGHQVVVITAKDMLHYKAWEFMKEAAYYVTVNKATEFYKIIEMAKRKFPGEEDRREVFLTPLVKNGHPEIETLFGNPAINLARLWIGAV